MIRDLGNGLYILSGRVVGEPRMAFVGQAKDKAKGSCGIIVGKNKDTTNDIRNLTAWYELAPVLGNAVKGQHVLAVASKSEREYNGRTYVDYECEWCAVAESYQTAQNGSKTVAGTQAGNYTNGTQQQAKNGSQSLTEGAEDFDDDSLPF